MPPLIATETTDFWARKISDLVFLQTNEEQLKLSKGNERPLTCRTCLNCSSKLQPLFCCDEFDVSLDVDEFDSRLP